MALFVQKYGGSSVGSIDCIHRVAERIVQAKKLGHDIVVVVSAMFGETDRLIGLAQAITQKPDAREYDILASAGEKISAALLAMTLINKGCAACSYSGEQAGILTDDCHMAAEILEVNPSQIIDALAENKVAVVAGFQGISGQGETTTLGRGGSDTTAVALAAALNADECQIYTDVPGVFTTDPRVVPEAYQLDQISFDEMLEMSSLGAKVLQKQSVAMARKYQVRLRVLSSFHETPGTLITFEYTKFSQPSPVTGIAFQKDLALLQLFPKDQIEAELLNFIHHEAIGIDTISQNSIVLKQGDYGCAVQKIIRFIEENQLETQMLQGDSSVAKISLVGAQIGSHFGIASTAFQTMKAIGVDIKLSISSGVKLSMIVKESDLDRSVRAIHAAFDLDRINQKAPIFEQNYA